MLIDTAVYTRFWCVILMGCLLILAGCGDISFDEDRSLNTQADTLLGMTESFGSDIEILVDGKRRVLARAPRTVLREGSNVNRTDLFGPPVEITVFDSTGAVETFIISDRATYLSRQLQFEFNGNVVVETGKNRTLRTEQLLWDEISTRFSTTGFVTIISPADSITGYGFNGTQDLSSYTLRTVSGRITLD
ncbi:MAG: LPS export ABC transporter periplasmic protein LptC [Balneolales bacterium]|nr:LPS export ABC transporter periplasmic protein LptC [Balneolales bacterium]